MLMAEEGRLTPTLSEILAAGGAPGFGASGLGLSPQRPTAAAVALLLICAIEQAQRPRSVIERENAAAEALLAEAAPGRAEPAPTDPAAANAALKLRLAHLLETIASAPDPQARRLEERIWALLAGEHGRA